VTPVDPPKSPDELHRKYLEERDKRLAGNREKLDLIGDLQKYLDDPYTPAVPRQAITEHSEVIIVGAGLGGLMIGAGLRKAGVKRIRLIDSAGDVGGVWYWNRYPGVRCDTESLVYLPLLEEVGVMPHDRYSTGPFIWEHARSIARKFNLYDDALLQTAVTGMEWLEADSHWRLRTDRGDELTAHFVIMANGSLQKPRLPAIPGVTDFKGHTFHTSRWDTAYTGGTAESDPTNLADKVIGVIGTGATAVQCVPPLGRSAKDVYVFQRTPPTIGVRNHGPVDPAWAASLKPGWQNERRANFTEALYGGAQVDLVNDGWTELFRALVSDPKYATMTPSEAAEARERADIEMMERIRQRITDTVKDPETAEALKPWYAYLCKRPTFHDEYLDAFNLPNVHLVDTQGAGVEKITASGAVVNGKEYKLDCLIFATGFEGLEIAYTEKIGFDVVGRNGLRLSEKWADGFHTLHGIMTAGFPNMFFQSMPNGQNTITINFPDAMQQNASQMAWIIAEVIRRGAKSFEVTREAEQDWERTILELAPDNRAFLESCTPGRGNNDGVVDKRPPANRDYGPGPPAFFRVLAAWREDGSLPGLHLEYPEGREQGRTPAETAAGLSSSLH